MMSAAAGGALPRNVATGGLNAFAVASLNLGRYSFGTQSSIDAGFVIGGAALLPDHGADSDHA